MGAAFTAAFCAKTADAMSDPPPASATNSRLDGRLITYRCYQHYPSSAGNSSSSGFGRITSVINTGATGSGAPRRIELMLHAEFQPWPVMHA
jgi:hypothetical protein